METFVGRVSLVTGSSSGIGRSTALLYAKHGAKVIVSDIIDERGTQEPVDVIIQEGGTAAYIKTDVSSAIECQNLVEQTLSFWGRLDYACNVGLTCTAAIEYSKANIRINAVGSAFIHTPMISVLDENPETLNMLVSMHPIGRLGEPEEVAELVIWLNSSQASFVTGNFYAIDGGYLA